MLFEVPPMTEFRARGQICASGVSAKVFYERGGQFECRRQIVDSIVVTEDVLTEPILKLRLFVEAMGSTAL